MHRATTVFPMSSQTSPSSIRAPIQIGSSLSTACWNKAIVGVRAAAFWAAIVLPLAYVPAAYGTMGFEGAWSALALIAVHMACVVIGHEHNTTSNNPSTNA
jgi:hypothetical protein